MREGEGGLISLSLSCLTHLKRSPQMWRHTWLTNNSGGS